MSNLLQKQKHMKALFASSLLFLSICTLSAQSTEPGKLSRNGLEIFNQVLKHDKTNTGFLLGLKATRILRNPEFKIGIRALVGINNMERKDGAAGNFFELDQIYSLGFELQKSIVKAGKFELSAQALVGLTLISEMQRGGDVQDFSWTGYYSLEPGISLSYHISPKWNLFTGTSYIIQSIDADRLVFDDLNLNFGLGFRF